MTYNPFTAAYDQLEHEINFLKNKEKNLSKEIEWFDSFELKKTTLLLAKRKEAKDDLLDELENNKKELEYLNKKTNEINKVLKPNIAFDIFLPVIIIFDHERRNLKSQIDEIKVKITKRQQKQITGEKAVNDLSNEIQQYTNLIERFKSFERENIAKDLTALQKKIAPLNKDFHRVLELKNKVDGELRPVLEQIHGFESKVMTARANISSAEYLERQLSSAGNSYERAKLHQECEIKFGDGKPTKVIATNQRLIRELERDLNKAKKRALEIATKAARNIKKIVIDGNNLCYEGNNFVGLNPLLAITKELQQKYEMVVVFDSAIRSMLKANDKQIDSQFTEGVKIHIVATKELADKTVLELGCGDVSCYILSNDRYGEFNDKEIVENKRLLRHEIVDGKIMIHDLNINLKYVLDKR